MKCGCRCINCKSQNLTEYEFIAQDGYTDMHHTCTDCKTHFNHLDGEIYKKCNICKI